MSRGNVSRWRRNKWVSNQISTIKDVLHVDYSYEVLDAVNKLIQERDYFKKASFKLASNLNSLREEFRKKKVHHKFIVIKDKRKFNPYSNYNGVLFFHDGLIGTKVIVWRK